jgi:hypothetical protein
MRAVFREHQRTTDEQKSDQHETRLGSYGHAAS